MNDRTVPTGLDLYILTFSMMDTSRETQRLQTVHTFHLFGSTIHILFNNTLYTLLVLNNLYDSLAITFITVARFGFSKCNAHVVRVTGLCHLRSLLIQVIVNIFKELEHLPKEIT